MPITYIGEEEQKYLDYRNLLLESKQEFALRKKFTLLQRSGLKLGERYGYDLLDPFTEEEVSTFESHYRVNLPQSFRNYLLLVSQEFPGYYPYTVSLSTDQNETVIDLKEARISSMIKIAHHSEYCRDFLVLNGKGNNPHKIGNNFGSIINITPEGVTLVKDSFSLPPPCYLYDYIETCDDYDVDEDLLIQKK